MIDPELIAAILEEVDKPEEKESDKSNHQKPEDENN